MRIFKQIAVSLLFILQLTPLTAQKKVKVNTATSQVLWLAKKFTGQHNGDIKLKEGTLLFNKEELKGGNFVVDMTTINTLDLQGEWKEKLDNHLKDDDFFAVKTYPSSLLVFKKIAKKSKNRYKIGADLTIKGITKPIEFELQTGTNTATTTLLIDRTLFNVKYASKTFGALADKAIEDVFELKIELKY